MLPARYTTLIYRRLKWTFSRKMSKDHNVVPSEKGLYISSVLWPSYQYDLGMVPGQQGERGGTASFMISCALSLRVVCLV